MGEAHDYEEMMAAMARATNEHEMQEKQMQVEMWHAFGRRAYVEAWKSGINSGLPKAIIVFGQIIHVSLAG